MGRYLGKRGLCGRPGQVCAAGVGGMARLWGGPSPRLASKRAQLLASFHPPWVWVTPAFSQAWRGLSVLTANRDLLLEGS